REGQGRVKTVFNYRLLFYPSPTPSHRGRGIFFLSQQHCRREGGVKETALMLHYRFREKTIIRGVFFMPFTAVTVFGILTGIVIIPVLHSRPARGFSKQSVKQKKPFSSGKCFHLYYS
ncbi:MAG: hypothetical protein V2I97_24170, partial [Desulfococcaceae bacterium]|nr:hypothetical protein [Desulfococcaceae bacterium]